MNQTLRRLLVALLLAVVIYGAFVAATGYRKLELALSTFQFRYLALALCLSSFNYVLRFLKWEYYLARLGIRHVPKLDSFLVFLSGFVLTITPGKIGEVFKSAVLGETHNVDPASTAPIVLAERLTDVIAIVVLIVLGSLGFSGGMVWALLGAAAVAAGMVLLLWPVPIRKFIEHLKRRPGAAASLAPRLETAHVSLLRIATPGALVIPTMLSLVGWGAEGVSLWFLIRGFEQSANIFHAIFFYATATLAGALVPVPGGLGVSEGILQSQMVEIGKIATGAAMGSMLMCRFSTLWWGVIVGFCALGLLKLKYKDLFSAKREHGRGKPT